MDQDQPPALLESGVKRKADTVEAVDVLVKALKTESEGSFVDSEGEGQHLASLISSDALKTEQDEYFEECKIKEENPDINNAEDIKSESLVDEEIVEEKFKKFKKFWQIFIKRGNPMHQVVCPGNCKSKVNMENVKKHLLKVHPNMKTDNIFCPYCDKVCRPEDVSKHIPACSNLKNPATSKQSKETLQSSPGSDSQLFWQLDQQGFVSCPEEKCIYNVKKNLVKKMDHHVRKVHPDINLECIYCKNCDGVVFLSHLVQHGQQCCPEKPVKEKLWSSSGFCEDFPATLILQGLSTLSMTLDDFSLFSSKLFLDAYLLSNFMVSSGNTVKCTWMYLNYMETSKVKDRVQVLSPTKFLLAVRELSKDRWKINVGPFREESTSFENLYFKGISVKFEV